MSQIGTVIRIRRDELGISAAELARAVGVSPQAVSNWENQAARSPAKAHLRKIAETLSLKLEQLLGPVQSAQESEEARLLEVFRSLSSADRRVALRLLAAIRD